MVCTLDLLYALTLFQPQVFTHQFKKRYWEELRQSDIILSVWRRKTILFSNQTTPSVFEIQLFAQQIKRKVLQNKVMGSVFFFLRGKPSRTIIFSEALGRSIKNI